MQLELLAKRLPGLAVQPALVEDQGAAFEVAPERVPGFVSPTFSVEDWPDNAPVLLIEAAGAVGKSAAALALADQLNWPLVRAEKAQVGDYTLLGLIQDALGVTGTYVRDVALAEAGVVIDALDEAHLRAGTENFLAFVRNIMKVSGAQLLPSVRPPSIVLFSRSDTAELIRLAFADADVPLAHVRLDFFGHKAACDFIASYLRLRFHETKRPEYNVALASPRPFELLRDGRMGQIAKVLLGDANASLRSEWQRVSDFLGYAPVLIALAESLAVMNPAAQVLHLEATDEGLLLRQMVNYILEREQGKFADNIGPKLQALLPVDVERDVVMERLYSPREQAIRLLGWTSGSTLATGLPGSLPDAVRAHYESAVETFLPDHPFVKGRQFASVVFADFVAAITTCDLESRLALGTAPHLLVGDVGPFFTRFLGQTNGRDQSVCIPEGAIEAVIWSWSQEAELARATDIEVRVSLTDEDPYVVCGRSEASEWSSLELKVTDLTGALALRRPLRNATVLTDFGLILGTRGGQFQIGPNVLVLAEELIIEAETLRVTGDGVRLGATECLANYLTKIESGDDSLSVYAAEPPPRLRPYLRTLKSNQYTVPYQRYVDLRSVFGCFKPTVKGLSAYAQWLDNKIVRDNPHRLRILQQLIAAGITVKSSDWYHLDVNAMDRVGFGLEDFRTGRPSDSVLSFLVHGGHGELVLDNI